MPRTADSTVLARLAKNIRAMIDEEGISIRQLAEKAGVSNNIISRMLREEREPTLSSIERVCKALGISVDEALRDTPRRVRAAV